MVTVEGRILDRPEWGLKLGVEKNIEGEETRLAVFYDNEITYDVMGTYASAVCTARWKSRDDGAWELRLTVHSLQIWDGSEWRELKPRARPRRGKSEERTAKLPERPSAPARKEGKPDITF